MKHLLFDSATVLSTSVTKPVGPTLGADITAQQSCYPATTSEVFPLLQTCKRSNRRRLWPPVETSIIISVHYLPLRILEIRQQNICATPSDDLTLKGNLGATA